MRPSIRLGRVFGIDIGVHYSWLIIAFLIVSPPLLPVLESQQPPEQARQELENRLPRDPRERCSVETRVETGEPYREILNVIKEIRADLLVMNIHGKSGLERGLLGSTAERVIRGATCPVMAIPPAKRKRDARSLN